MDLSSYFGGVIIKFFIIGFAIGSAGSIGGYLLASWAFEHVRVEFF